MRQLILVLCAFLKVALNCDFTDDAQKKWHDSWSRVECCNSTYKVKNLYKNQNWRWKKLEWSQGHLNGPVLTQRKWWRTINLYLRILDPEKSTDFNGVRRKQFGLLNTNGNDVASGTQCQSGNPAGRHTASGRLNTSQSKAPWKRCSRATAECYRCRVKPHYGQECQRAINVICRNCRRRGHLACVCTTKVKKKANQ